MASLKNIFHRMLHGPCSRTNDKLMNKLKSIPDSQSTFFSGPFLTFLEHPYVKLMNEKLESMCKLVGRQCQVVGQHRARRTIQILSLYRNLYGGQQGPTREFLKKLGDILRLKNGTGKFMFCAVLFDWNKERITDDMFNRTKDDLKNFIELHARSNEKEMKDIDGEVWEKVVDSPSFKLWRCPLQGSSLYKYKVFGTYKDLPASSFYKVQLDLDYRKKWDDYVIQLDRVEYDEQSGSELIYWATNFPLKFLSRRDYLYVRRCEVDKAHKVMTISALAVNHPNYPVTDNYVRVDPYTSHMLIKPHTSFEEKGFDYVLSYYDDPKLSAPSWAVNKMTVSSLPSFVSTIHQAALKLHQSKVVVVDENMNNNSSDSSSCSMHSRIIHMGTAYAYNIDTEKNQS